jgi:hypothetical protein
MLTIVKDTNKQTMIWVLERYVFIIISCNMPDFYLRVTGLNQALIILGGVLCGFPHSIQADILIVL